MIKLSSCDIFFELLVPGVLVTLPNKCHKLREFLRRELIYCILDFNQTHDANAITVWRNLLGFQSLEHSQVKRSVPLTRNSRRIMSGALKNLSPQRTRRPRRKTNEEVRNQGKRKQLSQLSHEILIVLVRADPKPDDEIPVLLGNRAIVIADSD
jgi:hypothetical protein